MPSVNWTGNPFADSGLAAIAAAVNVQQVEDLTPEDLHKAASELKRILLSDQALGINVDKAFVKSSLSQIFPNNELVNPSHWRDNKTYEVKAQRVKEKFLEVFEQDLKRAVACLGQIGNTACWVCGRHVPNDATVSVRKDKMPLLAGIVNFYPAFTYGVKVCGLCAFSLRFLPMAVMKTGVINRLWLLHSQSPIAIAIAKDYGWRHFNSAISANESLEFYSKWRTAGEAGTVLYLLCQLLEDLRGQLRAIYENPLPTTAYVFSNDNQRPFVRALPVPNELLRFLAQLQIKSHRAFQRFWQEILLLNSGLDGKGRKIRIGFIQRVAGQLLQGASLIGDCLQGGDNDRPPRLIGGWIGHRLYLQEVRKMRQAKLAVLERLGLRIAQCEDAKKRTNELRKAQPNELYAVFLGYVQEGWLKREEFYTLVPPNEYSSMSELRDILLAVIYEWQHCQEHGEGFQSLLPQESETSSDETLKCVQEIGERLWQQLPNPSGWIPQLQTAKSDDRIRAVYLMAIEQKAMSFSDFVFLAPLRDHQRLRLLRDYLLAFLFERSREEMAQEEAKIL